jgi:hypothetical protein
MSPITETAVILATFAAASFSLSELFARRAKASGEIQRTAPILPMNYPDRDRP